MMMNGKPQKGEEDTDILLELDPHDPRAVAKSFEKFKVQVQALIAELESFSKECTHLRWSYALIRSEHELRHELEKFLARIQENVGLLTSGAVSSPTTPASVRKNSKIQQSPSWFEKLADSFVEFHDQLQEFSEYTNEIPKVNKLLKNMAESLKYRCLTLAIHKGHIDPFYVHELAVLMVPGINQIASSLHLFTTYGMPGMEYEQKSDIEGVLNVPAVATFFSAVTATLLQISYTLPPSTTIYITNSFWFCSLILSIGSTLNSLLAIAWKRSIFGSQRRLSLPWATVWIRASVPIMLAISIACFAAGLVLFTFASHQAIYTSVVTIVSTAVASLGLVTVLLVLIYEYCIMPLVARFSPSKAPQTPKEEYMLKRFQSQSSISSRSSTSATIVDSSIGMFNRIRNYIFSLYQPATPEADEERVIDADDVPAYLQPTYPDEALAHVMNRVSSMMPVTRRLWAVVPEGKPRMEVPHIMIPTHQSPRGFDNPPITPSTRDSADRKIPLQAGDLQDLEYSPNKHLLAMTSYDKAAEQSTTVVFTTEDYGYTFRYGHTQRRSSKQVAWSPDGEKLLVRLSYSIDILHSNCRLFFSAKRPNTIESAAWYKKTGEKDLSFLTVEKNSVFRISMEGQVQNEYRFRDLSLRTISVVPKTNLLLVVGKVILPNGRLSIHGKAERQLILYDMKAGVYNNRLPILDDVQHITPATRLMQSRGGFDILLGYRNAAPPRFWTLEPNLRGPAQLRASTTYLKGKDLRGFTCLAGNKEELLLCTDSSGNIMIWDRESGQAVGQVEAQVVGTQSRNIAVGPVDSRGRISFATAGSKELNLWWFDPPLWNASAP